MKWIQKAKLKKGALHRWAGVSADHKFTADELQMLLAHADAELGHANKHGDAQDRKRARRHQRMVLFAQIARGFRPAFSRKHSKRKKAYRGRR